MKEQNRAMEKRDLPFHRPHITEDEIAGVVDSLRSGWLTMGPKTVKFEEAFTEYLGSGVNSVAVNSCTAALHLALKAVGIKEGDEVIVPDMTFTATAEVVCYFNAIPIVADVERDTHNVSVEAIERAITPRTRAIIPVHYAGQPSDMDEIMALAESHGLKVIEDAAHALPAWYRGKKVGTIGDITAFSFYVTKTLSTGEGGMITTASAEWAERMKTLRLHGISRDAWKRYSKDGNWYYEVVEAGYKYNMTDLQAALGLAQMKKLEWMWSRRKAIAERYTAAFAGLSDVLTTPVVRPDRVSAWHLYAIKLNTAALSIDRAEFMEELKKDGVATSVHFIPLHRHPFYRNFFGYKTGQFPDSEWIFKRIVSLPIYPDMTDGDVDYVIERVSAAALRFKR